jgi:hypothetical protein
MIVSISFTNGPPFTPFLVKEAAHDNLCGNKTLTNYIFGTNHVVLNTGKDGVLQASIVFVLHSTTDASA